MTTKTFDQLIDKLKSLFTLPINFPEFEIVDGFYYCRNRHIAVINNINEIEPPPNKDYNPLLACYNISSNLNEFYLYRDAIKDLSKKFSDYESMKNGVDHRNTMGSGSAITAERTGLWEDDAYKLIENICKLQLVIFYAIHNNFGVWKSKYYSENNSTLIDKLVCQVTQELIREDELLTKCYEYLKKYEHFECDDIKNNINQYVPFVLNMPYTEENEWEIINKMPTTVLNCFPIDKKMTDESWNDFFERCKVGEDVQDKLVEILRHTDYRLIEQKKCSIKYFNDFNKEKYQGAIAAIDFHL